MALNEKQDWSAVGEPVAASDWSSVGEPVKSDTTSASPLRRVADVGISALKGAISVPEAVVGLADIPTAGYAGKLAESIGFRPKEAKETLDKYLSPQQIEANKAVSDAKGFFPTIGAALQYPSTIGHSVIESLPVMGGGGVIARGVSKAAEKISPYVAGAIGEGVISGGLAAEQVRQQTEDGTLSPGQSGAALASGAGTAVFGAVGGRIAKKFGVADIDTLLAGGKLGVTSKGVARRIVEGGLTEGAFEELPQSIQEQVWQNAALGKPLMEGVAESGAMGLLAGGVMGGIAGGLTGRKVPTNVPPAAEEAPPVIPPPGPVTAAAQAAGLPAPGIEVTDLGPLDEVTLQSPPEEITLTNPYLPTTGKPAQLPSGPVTGKPVDEYIEAAPAPQEQPPSIDGLQVSYGSIPVKEPQALVASPVNAQIARLQAAVAAGQAGPITRAAARTPTDYLPSIATPRPSASAQQPPAGRAPAVATEQDWQRVGTPVSAPQQAPTAVQAGKPQVERRSDREERQRRAQAIGNRIVTLPSGKTVEVNGSGQNLYWHDPSVKGVRMDLAPPIIMPPSTGWTEMKMPPLMQMT